MIRPFLNFLLNKKLRLSLLIISIPLVFSACAFLRPPSPPPAKPAKIAVVLGGGGSKGFAHIGVLKVLEAQKIPIHMIVGTSAGSIVGSLYASGKTAFQLQDIALRMDEDNVIDYNWTIWTGGLIKGDKLEDFINAHVRNAPIEKLKIPFYAVATNIATGEEIVFGRGNTGMAVRASCSVPAIFHPLKIGSNTYVDGGVVSPVPVDVARRNGADIVIAVDISKRIIKTVPDGMVESLKKSVDIMYARIAEYQIRNADIVIRPDMKNIGSTEMEKFNEAILEGEKAATLKMPELKIIIENLKREGRL
ncbi:MAG TPA: patatin-like phospholipase family protein [Smithella sp.]|nr:patatin-like phospholipase family protein [Smithella sp.]MDM7988510.1 patatin-like phospholipase family protein [Smithella sp.]HNY48953.1 patatin-like phospholipase family protein [Smithella sp.]HOG89037.1 patatin-like phospholipase family protein [Smithella sp.]HOU49753.1 patatin-like phospholipase family protein [Smithella sp.]